jgi:nitrous oxidase accessory protein
MLPQINITDLPAEILQTKPGLTNAIANDGKGDQDAIQAAVDWIAAQRTAGNMDKTTLYLPEGTFDLSKPVKVNTPDITFAGAGLGKTILKNAESFQVGIQGLMDKGIDDSEINRNAYLFTLGQKANNTTFTEMTLTGPTVHGALYGFKADGLVIKNVEFNDFAWSSVRLFNMSRVQISDNVFFDAGGNLEKPDVTGGAIYATYLSDSEIGNNKISKREGGSDKKFFGIKGRQFTQTHIHHNTIKTNFAIELPFEDDSFVEIDHNFLGGTVSIPKFSGGKVPPGGFTFRIHHNYFTNSYALEWTRNGAEISHNVFVFDPKRDSGNLISSFGQEPAAGATKFYNNLIQNPGRGLFWSKGVYNNFSFYNNEVIANKTETPRTEGLFGFSGDTNFKTIEIRDNIIKVQGLSRPLMRNAESYSANIKNNEFVNITDIDQFENPKTGAQRGLIEPLVFQVGAHGEFSVDGVKVSQSSEEKPKEEKRSQFPGPIWLLLGLLGPLGAWLILHMRKQHANAPK